MPASPISTKQPVSN